MQQYLFPITINSVVCLLWLFIFFRDRKKAMDAISVGTKTLLSMMPFLLILVGLLGLFSSMFQTKDIETFIGSMNGVRGFIVVSFFSSFLQIPGLISVPIAATLYHNGIPASIAAVFITASTMSSVVTFPLERRYLGFRFAVMRICLTFVLCIAVGVLTGVIMKAIGG